MGIFSKLIRPKPKKFISIMIPLVSDITVYAVSRSWTN